jgi:hypothetical protein
MPSEKRKVAVAIGVSDAKPLAYLQAATNSARQFFDWASAFGYDAKLITDENEPLTMDRLCRELEAVLEAKKEPIYRLILYFAGHGLIREAEEGLWLLSDWHDELRAVAVEPLKRRLARYNIGQIAIISDSCRSLPGDIEAADLVPDAVLGRGPGERGDPAVDKFIAAQDASETFAIPGPNPSDDRCIFSGVLLEGLWGVNQTAFSTVVRGRITSQSLARFLKAEVPAVAQRYGRKLNPVTSPSFPEGEDIYYETPPQTAPALPPWPPPDQVLRMGPSRSDKGPAPPDKAAQASAALFDRIQTQPRPAAFETGSGFAVAGGVIRSLWLPRGVFGEQHRDENWWRVREGGSLRLQEPAAVLIEFDDGSCAALPALPEFIGSLIRDERGVSAAVYRLIHSPDGDDLAATAIAQLEQGSLRADDAVDLAARLRMLKHVDPVLGVLSAYLYDAVGDVESIRRIAFYYADRGQPIPYDVALLAQLHGQLASRNLVVTVPAVSRREPRTDVERSYAWTHEATPQTQGIVGGLWPWMRQGWIFLSDPSDSGSTLVLPGLIELTGELLKGRFATMNSVGARALIRRFDLEEYKAIEAISTDRPVGTVQKAVDTGSTDRTVGTA